MVYAGHAGNREYVVEGMDWVLQVKGRGEEMLMH